MTSCAIEWRVVLIFASVCTCVYCTEQLNATNLIYPMKSIAKKLKQKLGFCWFVCPNFHFGPLLTFTFHFFLTFVSLQLAAEWAGRTYLTSNGCAGRLEGWDPVFTLGVLRTWWGQSRCLHSTFTFLHLKVAALGRLRLRLDPKDLPQLAHNCNCVNNCAPIFYKHLLERAWFVNFFND